MQLKTYKEIFVRFFDKVTDKICVVSAAFRFHLRFPTALFPVISRRHRAYC